MPTSLVDGPNTVTQNTVYALPGRVKFVTSGSTLETTVGTTGGTYVAITATTTGVVLGGIFVRCTSGDTTVVLKDY